MKTGRWLAGTVLLCAQLALADCVVPMPLSVLPDGSQAHRATMAAAHRRVWDYIDAAESYLACLDNESNRTGGRQAVEDRVAAHNATVASIVRLHAQLRTEIERFNQRQ